MTGLEEMRREAERLFRAGVAAADPARAVHAALARQPVEAPAGGRLFLVALGKAARAMAGAALENLPPVEAALVVTNYENDGPVAGARVMAAGHPVPDAAGQAAAQEVQALLARAGPRDLVLALISGGGSALLPAPVAGVSLADKAATSRLLLGAGLDIVAMNAVRQHLSTLKGGRFLRASAPARVRAMILSDVIGDDLRAIASGPTAEPLLSRKAVVEMLRAMDLWQALPVPVRQALLRADEAPALPEAENMLIGSNRMSLEAMLAAGGSWPLRAAPDALTGDVADAAARILDMMHGAPPDAPMAVLLGGETTVKLRGAGLGGRNQELALRVALGARLRRDWVFLSGGTDGRDGPTEAAGGLVDGGTVARIQAAGGDPAQLLAENDSNRALGLSGDLLVTGATGTNVADLQVLLVAAPA